MITLEVNSYCQDCLNFEPEVIKDTFYNQGLDKRIVTTKVCCKHNYRCELLLKHIKSQVRDK